MFMYVCRFNWTNLDTIYDAIVAAGMKPYVELSFMPKALASGTMTFLAYKANVTPPKNYTQWGLVSNNSSSSSISRVCVIV